MARAAAPTGSQSQGPRSDRGRVSKQQIAGEEQEGPEPCISLSRLTMFVCGVCGVHACVCVWRERGTERMAVTCNKNVGSRGCPWFKFQFYHLLCVLGQDA